MWMKKLPVTKDISNMKPFNLKVMTDEYVMYYLNVSIWSDKSYLMRNKSCLCTNNMSFKYVTKSKTYEI